jgi:GNAT superfamily N-acetyltransferase
MNAVDFRFATSEDATRLSEIAFAAKEHWKYPSEWMEWWRPDLTVSPHYLETEKVRVAEYHREVIGFAGFSWGIRGRYVEHLWILPAYIGQGLGRRLFLEMVQLARHEGTANLFINSDPNAEAFYVKMGAVRIGEEVYTLPDGKRREVPLLMYRLS